jgi:hypothetical protein
MPSNAQGSRVSLLYAIESIFGTSPAGPGVYRPLRSTGNSIELSKSTFQSSELRSDRQIADFRHGAKRVDGDVDVELMPYDFDALLEAALGGTWTGVVTSTATTLQITAATGTITRPSGSFITDGFLAGMMIKLGGFTAPGNNNYFILNAVNALTMTVTSFTGMVDEAASAGRTCTQGDTLKAGTTRRGISIEVGHTDISQYRLYKGCVIDKFSASLKPGAPCTGKLSFIGLDMVLGGASVDATPLASFGGSPFDTFNGSIKEGGSNIAIITALDFSLDNNAKAAETLFAATAADVNFGRSNVTGTITAYLQDAALYNKFINETLTSIEFTMGTTRTHKYKMSSVKYGAAKAPTQNEGPITIQLPFQAIYNSTDASQVVLTRA